MSFSVFGYGSLVNRATLPNAIAIRRVTVTGWRRSWRATSLTPRGGVCALSVVADPSCAIDGLMVTLDDAHWPLIRAREHRYEPLTLCGEHAGGIIFQAAPAVDRFGDADHPIHLSYVDCIVQGYRGEFGPRGVDRLFASTEGWHVPILDDRHALRYPRAQRLSPYELRLVDAMLKTVDANVLPADDEAYQ